MLERCIGLCPGWSVILQLEPAYYEAIFILADSKDLDRMWVSNANNTLAESGREIDKGLVLYF